MLHTTCYIQVTNDRLRTRYRRQVFHVTQIIDQIQVQVTRAMLQAPCYEPHVTYTLQTTGFSCYTDYRLDLGSGYSHITSAMLQTTGYTCYTYYTHYNGSKNVADL